MFATKVQKYLRCVLDIPHEDRTILHKLRYRAGEWWLRRIFPLLYGAFVQPDTRIGDGLILPHGWYGVFMSGHAVVGQRVTILQHVVIGANVTDSPVVGDDVYIGSGAKLIGRCVIGNGARIGAGVVLVNAMIPPGAVIVNKSAYDLTNERFVYSQD